MWGQEKSFFLKWEVFANGNDPAERKPLCTRVRKGRVDGASKRGWNLLWKRRS